MLTHRQICSILFGLAGVSLATSALAQSEGQSPSYYDTAGPSYHQAASQVAVPIISSGSRKVFLVDSESAPPVVVRTNPSPTPVDKSETHGRHPTSSDSLPPNMDRGVKDLEAGMNDLRQYTGDMAAHIQKKGIRGFLAVPPDIKDQGQAVGKKIGGG